MKNKNQKFASSTKELALRRQNNQCGLCGIKIFSLGEAGRLKHFFGEIGHAHHIVHVKLNGNNELENCVIVCESCHYLIHEGGSYRNGTVVGKVQDFPFYGKMIF